MDFYVDDVYGFEGFEFKYATSGSSEGIFHLLAKTKAQTPDLPVYTLEGEYEGYREYGAGIGIKVKEIPEDVEAIRKLPLGIWFISNPSARNGNIISNEFIKQICEMGHRVVLDLAYLGLTQRYTFDVSHKNIVAVVTSMSKPFGLFYYRIGFLFAREEVKTLYGNKWFKNIFSLILADRVFTKFSSDYFYNKYFRQQEKVIKQIESEVGLKLKPSDAMLIAHLDQDDVEKLPKNKQKLVKGYKRKSWYRFCLTRYFLQRKEEL